MGVPIGSSLELKQVATPANPPAAGSQLVYVKSDGKVYTKTSAGVEALVTADSVHLTGDETVAGNKSFTGLLDSTSTSTDPATNVNWGLSMARTLALTAANTKIFQAMSVTAVRAADSFDYTPANLNGLTGIIGSAQSLSLGAVSAMTGVVGYIFVNGVGVVTEAAAIRTQLQIFKSTAVVTNLYGIKIMDFVTQVGTVTNTYGLYIGDLTAGTQTNQPYGIYVSDAGMRNYFAGKVGIGTLAPAEMLDVTGNILASGTVTGTTHIGAHSGSGALLTGIPESGVTNLVADLAAKSPLIVPRAKCTHSANVTLTTAVAAAMALDTETVDNDNLHSTSTNNSRILLNRVGSWIVTAQVGFAGNATGRRIAMIYRNGTEECRNTAFMNTTATPCVAVTGIIESAAVTDYVELFAYQDSGGNLLTTASQVLLSVAFLGT